MNTDPRPPMYTLDALDLANAIYFARTREDLCALLGRDTSYDDATNRLLGVLCAAVQTHYVTDHREETDR